MPFGSRCEYANFEACVKANAGKEDPKAYCAELMRRTEKHCMAKTENEPTFRIAKTNRYEQQVFGWASVAVDVDGETIVDSQEHIIDPDDLEKAVYQFNLISREMDEKHTEAVQGRLIESLVVSPDKLEAMGLAKDALPQGWWVGFHVPDTDVFEKIVSGEYAMFSIAGSAVMEPAE